MYSCFHLPSHFEERGSFWSSIFIHPRIFLLLPHVAVPSGVFILHFFSFFLIVHAQSIIWISPKRCGPFLSFSIPFYLCTLCVCLACRTMFCFGLFACCYHPQLHKGLGSPLFGEWMSSGDHSIYEKEWLSVVSSVLLCNGLLYHRVSGSLFCCVDIVVCCVCIFFLVLNWFGVEIGSELAW